MSWRPKCETEYANGEAWPWYAQVPTIAVIACAICAITLVVSLVSALALSDHWYSSAASEMAFVALFATLFTAMAFGVGWSTTWRFGPACVLLGWLAPLGVVHLMEPGMYLSESIVFLGMSGIGAIPMMCGARCRERWHWAYIVCSIACATVTTICLKEVLSAIGHAMFN